jgi:hypothetical protein
MSSLQPMKTVHILEEDPELGEKLLGPRLDAARRECIARSAPFTNAASSEQLERTNMRIGIGLLILDGLVLRRVGLGGRFGAELLGQGDLLRPWQHEDVGTSLPRTGKWRVLQRGHMAVLDSDFMVRVARYPEVVSALFARAVRRSRHMAVNVAIIHQPRIDVRLHMLLWELADRFGTVRGDGVHLPLRLTHAMLGEMVAARRPTVTKSLGELAERGLVIWTGEDWHLQGEPPEELAAIGAISVASED